MRVLFIYSDVAVTNFRRFQHGIAYLSSSLKAQGTNTGLIHIYTRPQKEAFLKKIVDFAPDIIAYSSLTNQYPMVRMLAQWSRDLKIFTIYGGTHPTVAPEICIDTPGINAICIGEGDQAIKDFVTVFSKGEDITKVKNFWVKSAGQIYKSQIRPLIENLDTLPFPDYDLFPYEETDDFKASGCITLQASRGCLYSCTYCCNHYLKSLYPNKNKYLRFRSVENIIAELKFLLSKYPQARMVRFTDDALSSNSEWFEKFASYYGRQTAMPYSVNDHPHNITPQIAKLYKESGCRSISMGIESGNAYIREKIMKRPFRDKELIRAFTLLKKEGINTGAFNILGSPSESMASILDTVKVNAKCKPDVYINAYFQPFEKTIAANICKEAGWKIKDLPGSFFEEPVVELPTVSRDQMIFGFKYFGILVSWYKLLYWISQGKDWRATRLSDRLLKSGFIPYRLLNAIFLNRIDLKKRLPGIASLLTRIKRRVFKQNF